MRASFYPGFIAYDFGSSEVLFVDVHPTTSLENLPREDIGADLLSVQLAKRMKCKAIISMMPREKEFGIDLNRLPPPEDLAIDMFNDFVKKENRDKIAEYEKRYAWVALTREEHLEKRKIYDSFWSTVGALAKSDTLFVFVHIQDTTLRNFPSLVDVIPLYGLNEGDIKNIIEKMNRKYMLRFKNIKDDFVDFLIFDVKHQYKSIALQTFDTLDPKFFSGDMKEKHEKMLKRILDLGFDNICRELESAYTFDKHLRAIKNIGQKVPLKITYMFNFTGKLALGTKKFLKKFKGIEVEVSSFLSEVYTDLGTDILEDLISLILRSFTKNEIIQP